MDFGSYPHVSVLLNEVVEGLQVRAGGIYIDATVGAGGHSAAAGLHANAVETGAIDPTRVAFAALPRR